MSITELVRVVTPVCMVCKKATAVYLPADLVEKYRKGACVQEAFPALSPDQRELLISGTHPECWNNLFGEDN